MATIQQLLVSTNSYKPTLFVNADRVFVESVNVTRSVGTRTILFSAITKDFTSPSGRTVQLQFVVPRDVENISEYKPSIARDRALVRSSSPFYKFAFGFNNARLKAHFGKISRFTVQGTGRPINPSNSPGLDKHLISFVKTLKDENLIRG